MAADRHRGRPAPLGLVTGSALVLLALAAPVLTLRLGQSTNAGPASVGGPAATAITRLDDSGLGAGLSTPVETLTGDPAAVRFAGC